MPFGGDWRGFKLELCGFLFRGEEECKASAVGVGGLWKCERRGYILIWEYRWFFWMQRLLYVQARNARS